MVSPQTFLKSLQDNGIDFFTGVPDSLLADFCACVTENVAAGSHVIAANEGGAVGLAIGHYLATKKSGLVYLQNSGLGNTVNPILSLADPMVYSIPMMLVIGWRGQEGVPDEPQHKKQGAITTQLLDTMHIPYFVLPDNDDEAIVMIQTATEKMIERNAPIAIVVRDKTFSKYSKQSSSQETSQLTREEALRLVMESIPADTAIVSTTGKLSRELFELREARREDHAHDFLTVGGMGHASQIALGIALSKPEKEVYCFDGDGAAIMHLGSWGVIGQTAPKNFKHIVFNNGAHDSVGGQKTAADMMSFPEIAKACGYNEAFCIESVEELSGALQKLQNGVGPTLLEIKIKTGARSDLGRPTRTPIENKNDFMEFLQNHE